MDTVNDFVYLILLAENYGVECPLARYPMSASGTALCLQWVDSANSIPEPADLRADFLAGVVPNL